MCHDQMQKECKNTLRANCPAKLMGPAVYGQIAQQCISKHRPGSMLMSMLRHSTMWCFHGQVAWNFKTHEALVSCSQAIAISLASWRVFMKANWIRYKAVMHLARIATMAFAPVCIRTVSCAKYPVLNIEYSKVTESESPIVRWTFSRIQGANREVRNLWESPARKKGNS